MDPGGLAGLRGGGCPGALAVLLGHEMAAAWSQPHSQRRSGQAVLGANLAATGAIAAEVEQLIWGYLQLGLVALALAVFRLVD